LDLDFSRLAIQYLCLLFSLCVHEAAHAWMANLRGDPSARLMGRLTLDPRKHIDPLGTVILPLLMMATAVPYLFGWAKPVPFNPLNLKDMRKDPVLIAVAGPASNLIIAIISTIVLSILLIVARYVPQSEILLVLFQIVMMMMMINLVLMLFNLIPLPPLDGHYVLHYFLPPNGQRMLEQMGPFGIIIAIVVFAPYIRVILFPLRDALIWLATFGQGVG